jgi:DNA-binding GntR family transcriptional regulator
MSQATAERAYNYTRELLLDGTYQSGEFLSEGKVAEEIGLSRTPVREAFLRLEAEGFLKLYPKRGALVIPIRIEDGRNIIQARILLETFAIDQAAETAPERLNQLGTKLLDLVQQTQKPAQAWDASYHFHRYLIDAAGNEMVGELYEKLWVRQLRLTAASVNTPEQVELDLLEHHEIAKALQAGQGGTARNLLEEHIRAILPRIGLDATGLGIPEPARDFAPVVQHPHRGAGNA